MSATDILRHEHQVVMLALSGAEKLLHDIELNGKVNIERIRKFIDFSRHFTDGCHHIKEEKLLFPKMIDNGFDGDSGPVGVMLYEHQEGRKFIKNMFEIVSVNDDLEKSDIEKLSSNLRGYITLLRNHIYKENEILFNMADNVLRPEIQEELVQSFNKVETEEVGEGVHERFHQIAHELAES
ncbi:MAG: hemerythrin [Bacteroidetes bacterium]|nr:MAG: hemerythrin [Bacteroidota bacterium]